MLNQSPYSPNSTVMMMGLVSSLSMLSLTLSILFLCSEALALIPSVKANSVFQAIYYALRFIVKGRD